MVSRFANDKEFRTESSKLLALLILTLRGTPCIYQGSEIGMTNVHFDSINDYRDVEVFNVQKEYLERGMTENEFLELVHDNGRDNVRTPMQWDNSPNGGFTTGTPWLNSNPNYKDINVKKELNEENSILDFYKKILAYRKKHDSLIYGSYEEVKTVSDDLYIYKRENTEKFIMVLNHSEKHQNIEIDITDYKLQIQSIENGMSTVLLPWEARLYEFIS